VCLCVRMSASYEYIVPRNFKLLQELEDGEKGHNSGPHAPWVSLGLDGDDILLSDWNATVIGPQDTNLGDRIFTIKVHCGENYPTEPPTFKFVQKINMECVDKSGNVTTKLAALQNWSRDNTIFELLGAIRDAMVPAASLKQPPMDSTYN
jgi:ubiquitin-conjugating enzyme E2 variant